MNKKIKIAGVFSLIILSLGQCVYATVVGADVKTEKVLVSLNKSKLISLGHQVKIEEISQGNSTTATSNFKEVGEPAETTFIQPNQILINGKSLGTTNVLNLTPQISTVDVC